MKEYYNNQLFKSLILYYQNTFHNKFSRTNLRKKTVYLHIGWEKTGSTSIQSFLSNNYLKLRQVGYYYPNEGEVYQYNHTKISASLGEHKNPFWINDTHLLSKNQMIKYIQDLISSKPYNKFIFSHESFHAIKPELLKTAFRNCNVKIIAYIRRPDKWIISAFAQQVGFGNVVESSLREAIRIFLRKKAFQPFYFSDLKGFINTFGKENITVRIFEKEKLTGQDVVLDILTVLGIDCNISIKRQLRTSNPSLNIDQLAFMIEFGKFAKQHLQKNTIRQISKLIKDCRYSNTHNRIENYVKPRIKKRIMEMYQSEIDSISNIFFNGQEIFSNTVENKYEHYAGIQLDVAERYSKHIKKRIRKIKVNDPIEVQNIHLCLEKTINQLNTMR